MMYMSKSIVEFGDEDEVFGMIEIEDSNFPKLKHLLKTYKETYSDDYNWDDFLVWLKNKMDFEIIPTPDYSLYF